MPIVGVAFTTTVEIAALLGPLVQIAVPLPMLPVTVYIVVLVGETVKLLPTVPIGNNVYVLAPLGVITELFPLQIVALLALVKPTVGVGLTVMVVVKLLAAVLIQPAALTPAIVYPVVLVGLTTKLLPVAPLGVRV